MIAFPNCKINLGLSIINKRNDGYHNLETIFYPLTLTDALEIIPRSRYELSANDKETGVVNFSTSGFAIYGSTMDNLCIKAYHVLQENYPDLPTVQMHLMKAIPMGAGLGGGSSDGAFVLKILNNIFNLDLSTRELIHYAEKLGSDCPFFILNKPCFATGRGEIMEPITLDLSAYHIVLVNCGISVNTGWAFSQINLQSENTVSKYTENLKDFVKHPLSNWKNTLMNDFEEPVFKKYPAIKLIKDQLYENGALYASMSGSGSSVFGIFEKQATTKLHFPVEYRVYEILGMRYEV